MDLRGDLSAAARIAEEATESAKNLSSGVEDAEQTALELASSAERLPEISGLIHEILTDWGAELHGGVVQAADSADRLREGILRLAQIDKALAEGAEGMTPRTTPTSHLPGQTAP